MKSFWVSLILLLTPCAGYTMGSNTVGRAITAPCATCHGQDGRSLNPAWPNLAGQHTDYLIKQIQDLKRNDARHVDEAMAPFIQELTDEDIQNIADFYAKKPLPPGTHRLRRKNTRGETLYRQGDAKQHIMACATCHGVNGKGHGLPGFPSLAGQHIDYTMHQLEAFKHNNRQNDPGHTMRMVTAAMSPEDMHAIAYYLASLPQ
ncbi:MAG: cytochrome c4 [Legionella sp.]|nr:cytochrome c4 [Legionella sp.]